jgi:hypothetical protein
LKGDPHYEGCNDGIFFFGFFSKNIFEKENKRDEEDESNERKAFRPGQNLES